MFKSKAIITLVVIIAVAVFVVAAVSTVMTGGSEGYERPAAMQDNQEQSPAQDSTPTTEDDAGTEPTPERSDTDPAPASSVDKEANTQTSQETKAVSEQEAQALESSAANDSVAAMTTAVDSATEAAVNASEDVRRKADAAIMAATEAAKDGREEAEELVENVSSKAEEAVSTETQGSSQEKSAKTHTVTAQGLIYNPLVVKIQPGDTVAWQNMATHDTQSLAGLIPEGAEMWHSAMSENYRRTFEQQGIYIYKCTPHFGAGMGGAIIVGEPVNLDQIKQADAKGAAKRLVSKAIQEAESM